MLSRREVLVSATLAAAAAAIPSGTALAAQLTPTPRQTEGPFYPRVKPADTDADLLSVAGRPVLAQGVATIIAGRVLSPDGNPVAQAMVEIWQCDAFGRYHHPYDGGGGDANFQGYGVVRTDRDGRYQFRTIRPVPYPGRTPHIHFAIAGPGFERVTTQMYIAGEPRNETDIILASIRDPQARERVLVPLTADGNGTTLKGVFDIVLGG
jgi:protocatechuate 3,4-dioxygenase beta subunit